MDNFLEKYNLSKLTPEEIESISRVQWLAPKIPATQEDHLSSAVVRGQAGQHSETLYLKKNFF